MNMKSPPLPLAFFCVMALGASAHPATHPELEPETKDAKQRSLRGTGDAHLSLADFSRQLKDDERDLQEATYCGCDACTASVWNTMAGAYTCGARIDYMAASWGGNLSRPNACQYVSVEFPTICGPSCHPDLCNVPPPPAPAARCGCDSCTDAVWNHKAGGSHTCGARIEWLQTVDGGSYTYLNACRFVSNEYSNEECGPMCHPDLCDATPDPTPALTPEPPEPTSAPTPEPTSAPTRDPTSAPTPDPTSAPTPDPTPSPTPDPTPSPTHSPSNAPTPAPTTSPTKSPSEKPSTSPLESPPPPARCGCQSCTDEVWDTFAGAYQCGDRIEWMANPFGGGLSTEEEACRFVSDEFPTICGPACDPDLCGQCEIYPDPYVAPVDLPPNPPIQATDDLYCFPSFSVRERYTNAFFGGYTIEAKDGQGGLCGPGDNVFTSDTVSYNAAAQELTMEYKKINGVWVGSEVRVLLPENQGLTFGYGTFEFSVKSVSVLDDTNSIVSSALPSDMVLGLFTWDITDDYATHANWNHEVDVEISQWGDPANNQDVQFLTQPHHPGGPHFPERLSSGGPGTGPAEFDQGGHRYDFAWEPDRISWSTTAGGGQSRTYSTQIARDACAPDYIQCLPANVEVRINLWNMGGISVAPDVAGLTDGTRIEVVIDDFSFTPSSETHVPDGGTCSKHCQCASGSTCGASGTCEAPTGN